MQQISVPEVDPRSAQIVAGLATLYYRHNDFPRALALGIMALKYGSDTSQTVLLVAACFLKTGEAQQAEAVLTRLENRDLSTDERQALTYLKAKIEFRLGNTDDARSLLLQIADADVDAVLTGV